MAQAPITSCFCLLQSPKFAAFRSGFLLLESRKINCGWYPQAWSVQVRSSWNKIRQVSKEANVHITRIFSLDCIIWKLCLVTIMTQKIWIRRWSFPLQKINIKPIPTSPAGNHSWLSIAWSTRGHFSNLLSWRSQSDNLQHKALTRDYEES